MCDVADGRLVYRQAEELWGRGATTSEMARLLNLPYGRAEQLRRQIGVRRERIELSAERKLRTEQRQVAAACGVRSVVAPAAHISQSGMYAGSMEPPMTHFYEPRSSGRRE